MGASESRSRQETETGDDDDDGGGRGTASQSHDYYAILEVDEDASADEIRVSESPPCLPPSVLLLPSFLPLLARASRP
jgi:hypothetical protein